MKIALNRAKEMCDNSEDVNLRLLTALVPTILSNLKVCQLIFFVFVDICLLILFFNPIFILYFYNITEWF